MEEIVFKDSHLEVYFSQGKSDLLVVTFNEMGTKPGRGSWGGGALRKNGFSYLGFVSKLPNWFPESSVTAARKALSEVIERFAKIITYGHSQGGYASIRYASTFGASATISFCPQYSIAQNSMGGVDKRFSLYLKNTVDHREIIESDQGENCISYVFYDPKDYLDKINFTHIRDTIRNVRKIEMFGTGHQSVRAIANSEAIGDIIRYAATSDLPGIFKSVRKSKRKWPARKIFLARDLALRNKDTATKLVDDYEGPLTSDVTPGLVRNLFISCALDYLADNVERFLPNASQGVKLILLRALIATDKLDLAKSYGAEWSQQEGASKSILRLVSDLDKKSTIQNKKTTPFSENISFGFGWHAEESWGRWGAATRSRIFIKSTLLTGKTRSISIPVSCLSRSKQSIRARYLVDDRWIGVRVRKGMLTFENCGHSTTIDIFVNTVHSPYSLKLNDDRRIMGVRIACPSKWIINHYVGASVIARVSRFTKSLIPRVPTTKKPGKSTPLLTGN
ncbi:hypothetical protein QN085_09910 [Pseudomonas sp. M2(2023)]|uniref:hypothetical protein n=1 Tax=Pseudomonas sp. M2(2023) TaxID=3049084 RepID=UPI00255424C9|nr:hypothetical protein [Pseudomonas sp. M2(2023)]WIV25880.1 hypothetical protein QN085_09910 [Pseudomonas sp. M2(2023)]